jgi:hypothetical protein
MFTNFVVGAGESGKTTFRKQMRIIHNTTENKFSEEEVAGFRLQIYKNIFDGINFLISACVMNGIEVSHNITIIFKVVHVDIY